MQKQKSKDKIIVQENNFYKKIFVYPSYRHFFKVFKDTVYLIKIDKSGGNKR